MTSRKTSRYFSLGTVVLALSAAFSPALFAQGPAVDTAGPDAPTPVVEAAAPVMITPAIARPSIANPSYDGAHKFWDTKNRALFAAVAAFSGADFAVTRANLQSGGVELNPVVRVFGRSTAGLAVNFAGQTAGIVGMSYLFHKTGHHKMERLLSMVNIGGSAGAVGYGLVHR